MDNKTTFVGNPWKGLRSYQEGDVIYGRDEEIQALSQYVVNNTQTVLYGRSGIGKTSILNAGVFPVARAEGLYPVPVRLDHTDKYDYVSQLAAALSKAGLTACELVPAVDAENENLWEFFHRQYFSMEGGTARVQPLFVFDQFEEIFTLQKNEKVKLQFFSQLGDLLNDICPFYADAAAPAETNPSDSEGSLDDLSLDDLLSEENVEASDYLLHPAFHMVFALREDFLSYLERYTAYIPVMKNNRFSLQPINEEQAADIIMKPRPGLVDMKVAEQIIRKVTGRSDFSLDGIPELEVDSAVLSLYLDRLYEKMDKDAGRISGELVERFGDDIIKEFYEESISDLSLQDVQILETVLLTREGRRNNVSRTDLIAKGLEKPVLDRLVDERKLLRQFSYGDDFRIEFIHDILCPVVLRHIRDRELDAIRQQQKEQEALRHLENRKRNQQRARNDLDVLTTKGRRLLNNSKGFGSSVNIFDQSPVPIDAMACLITREDSCQEFTHRYRYDDSMDFSGLGKIVGVQDGRYYTSIEFQDDDNSVLLTKDSISKLRLRYEGEKIKEVMFVKSDPEGFEDMPFYKDGYCGIQLEYDSMGRETRRTYVDEEGCATWTADGYAGVSREYDEEGNIRKVSYFGVDDKPVPHTDGNHGYLSDYNEDGLEIRRVYVDENDVPVAILSGVAGRTFKYDELGRLTEESNLGPNLQPAADVEGYESARFEYDEESRLSKETYLDFSGHPLCVSEYASLHYSYGTLDEDHIYIDEAYFDADDAPMPDMHGTSFYRRVYDSRFNLCELLEFDAEGYSSSSISVEWGEDGVPSRLASKGSLYWFRFDRSNRFVEQYGELNEQGLKEETLRGGYGYEIERDARTGLPTGEVNIDRYNQAVPDDDGIYRRRYVRVSDRGDVLEERYEDIHGNPASDDDGAFGCLLDYDEKGCLSKKTYLGSDGKPAPLADTGILYVTIDNDEEGREIARHYFDSDGRPTPDSLGSYGDLTEYQEGRIRCTSVGKDDRPIETLMGYSVYETDFDDQQRIVRTCKYSKSGALFRHPKGYYIEENSYDDAALTKTVRYLGRKGQLVDTSDGYAYEVHEYDEMGRKVRMMRYDKKGRAVPDKDGECGYALEYGEDGRTICRISLDADKQPVMTSDGFCAIKRIYDAQGREIECYYYDEKQEPVMTRSGYGCRSIYTEQGNRVVYVTLDPEGNPMPYPSDLYLAIEKTMDSNDRVVMERYLDGQLEPTLDSTGCYGRSFRYEKGHVEESCCLDADGVPMTNQEGYTYKLRQLDDEGRIIFSEQFDLEHRPVLNQFGSYCTQSIYGDHDRKNIFLDQDGHPMLSSEGVASIYRVYDEKGRVVLELWLGLDDRPAADEHGLCGWQEEYLEDGSTLRYYFDSDQKPAPDEDGIIVLHSEYDETGCIRESCYDTEGKPMACNDGWISKTILRDDSGKKIGELYFDAEGRPMPDRDGDYGWKDLPSDSPSVRIMALLGPDGRPHKNGDGAYFVKRVYDDRKRLVARFYLDRHQFPIQQSDGTYGEEFEYLEDGSQLIYSLDEEGNRMPDSDGWLCQKRVMDAQGRTIRAEWFDEEHHPIANAYGDYGRETVYLDDENAKIVYGLDEKGMRHYDSDGIYGVKTRYLEGERHQLITYIDPEGNPQPVHGKYSSVEIWKDEHGREARMFRYSADGSPWFDEERICGKLRKYVDDGKGGTIMRYANLDEKGEPIVSKTGIMYYEDWLDRQDRLEQQMWFDRNMNPTCDEKGDYGVEYRYDGDKAETPMVFISLDEKGEPHDNREGYAKEIRVVDASGIVQSIFLDVDGNLVQRSSPRWLS